MTDTPGAPLPDTKLTCFFIAPIGDEGTDIRKRSDDVLEFIVKPVANACGYDIPIRADHIGKPGMITSQVIQRVIDDDLIVADLTGPNPNVFYELAIRHAVKKPVVQMIEKGQRIPFDVSPMRTVEYTTGDLRAAEQCKEELEKQIRAVQLEPRVCDSPIQSTEAILQIETIGGDLATGVSQALKYLAELDVSVKQNAQQLTGLVGRLNALWRHPSTISSGCTQDALIAPERVPDFGFGWAEALCTGNAQKLELLLEAPYGLKLRASAWDALGQLVSAMKDGDAVAAERAGKAVRSELDFRLDSVREPWEAAMLTAMISTLSYLSAVRA